jgi:hypothetical protein
MKSRVWTLAAAVLFLAGGEASARSAWQVADNVIALHGVTPGNANGGNGYWSTGALRAMCGTRCASGIAAQAIYNGDYYRWDDHGEGSPGCAAAHAAYNIPGINIAVVAHSMGGIAIAHMIHDAVNGFAGGWSCSGISIATAASWIGNLHSISSPFNGNQIADRFENPFSCLAWGTIGTVLFGAIPWFIINRLAEPRSVTSLASSNMNKFPSWLSNLGSYTIYNSYGSWDGSPNSGNDLGNKDWLWCMGGSGDVGIHDGVVDKYSAYAGRFSKNSSQWLMGVGVGVNHFDEVNDTQANGGAGFGSMTTQVWWHDFY